MLWRQNGGTVTHQGIAPKPMSKRPADRQLCPQYEDSGLLTSGFEFTLVDLMGCKAVLSVL